MMDVVERMFAPGVDWAGDVMERYGLPRDGNCRVIMASDGEWEICDAGRLPEVGETRGGPTIVDPSNRDLKLAANILFEMRRYSHLRKIGHNEHAAYTVARLGEMLAIVPVQNARSEGGKETGDKRKQEKAERARSAVALFDSLTGPEHDRAGIIAKRMGLSPATIRTYLREAGRKTKKR